MSKFKCVEFGAWFVEYSKSKSDVRQAASLPRSIRQPSTSSTGNVRLTFHSKLEVPRLKEWFQQCTNPSERQLAQYADTLNQSSLRAERWVGKTILFETDSLHNRNRVTVKSLKNWWKNNKQKNRTSKRRWTILHQGISTTKIIIMLVKRQTMERTIFNCTHRIKLKGDHKNNRDLGQFPIWTSLCPVCSPTRAFVEWNKEWGRILVVVHQRTYLCTIPQKWSDRINESLCSILLVFQVVFCTALIPH